MRVFNEVVIPMLLHGCKTRTVQKRHEARPQALELRYISRVEEVMIIDRVRKLTSDTNPSKKQ